MTRNVFFTHGTRNEQFLQQNLVEEYIKMFGMDILYIPRQLIAKDNVFNEEVVSQFDDSYLIEAYLENFDGFQGGGDLLTKFGIRQTDEITMVISQQRFSDLISQFLLLDQDIEVGERPQEGDLIYFPLSANYFEIKFVEHEEPFYQLGKNYTYKLKAELFEYSDEQGEFFAGDDELIDTGYTVQYYYLVSPGESAVATPLLDGDKVSQAIVTTNGSKYNFTPSVTVTGDGTGATAHAEMIVVNVGGSIPMTPAVFDPTVKDGKMVGLKILNGGAGYDVSRSTIDFTDPSSTGTKPVVIPTFDSNGTLIKVEITNEGSGYDSVERIVIDSEGSGYTTAAFDIESVPAGLSGEFTDGETVTGGTTGGTALIADWNKSEGWLKLKSPTDDFVIGELLVGNTSGASITIHSYDAMATTDTKYSESVTFETLADDIIDFSEGNPFGIGT
tara:strand:+ start:3821 stop:5155 length:1335 start_codon:yes stop_codon:yes gene_type:complete